MFNNIKKVIEHWYDKKFPAKFASIIAFVGFPFFTLSRMTFWRLRPMKTFLCEIRELMLIFFVLHSTGGTIRTIILVMKAHN